MGAPQCYQLAGCSLGRTSTNWKGFFDQKFAPGPFPVGLSISTSEEEPWLGASKDCKERFHQFLQPLVSQPGLDRNHVGTLQHSCRRHSPAFTVPNCAGFLFFVFCAVRKMQRAWSRLYFLGKWRLKKKKKKVTYFTIIIVMFLSKNSLKK